MLLSASKCQARGLRFEVRVWDGLGLRVLDLGSSGFRDFGLRLLGLFELFVGLYHKSDRSGNLCIYMYMFASL